MTQPWRPAESKRCPRCGLYWGLHQFPEAIEDEPDDEYLNWCLPCLRAAEGSSNLQLVPGCHSA